MVRGREKEKSYVTMLDSLCSFTYEDMNKVQDELRKKKLLRGEASPEEPGNERWLVEYKLHLGQIRS